MDIENKVIVITGAAQGLGKTFANDLAARKARLALADINMEQLEQVRGACEEAGIEARAYELNVADEPAVEKLFEQVVVDFGTVDVLINNAGITRDGLMARKKDEEIKKMSLANWQAVIDVNLTGTFLCGREFFVKLLEQKKPGVCVNISSISRSGNLGQSNYTATKAGVAEMTVTWAKEMARHGIRVGAIAPGYINTEMVAAIREDVKQKIIEQIPIRRLGDPSEISHSVFYILENDYFTGRVIECDGGLRI
ncbi:MAG TPA: SDR family oxidoreductase [Arenicellales bacterium]|jgi:3-oxoacyl-[acyl-carrier protein] reductase|nr:SDR family oxidoreductase [Arenicellales bacterium]